MSEFAEGYSRPAKGLEQELVKLLRDADEMRELLNTSDLEFESDDVPDRETYYTHIRTYAARLTIPALIDVMAKKHGHHDDLQAMVGQAFAFGARQATNEWELRHGTDSTPESRQADYQRATEYMDLYQHRILSRNTLNDVDRRRIIEFGRAVTHLYLQVFEDI